MIQTPYRTPLPQSLNEVGISVDDLCKRSDCPFCGDTCWKDSGTEVKFNCGLTYIWRGKEFVLEGLSKPQLCVIIAPCQGPDRVRQAMSLHVRELLQRPIPA